MDLNSAQTLTREMAKHKINQLHELRIHVTHGEPISINLLSGTCECFGTNMISALQYRLTDPGGYSFFTWAGCELEVIGTPELIYTTNDTSFPLLANINNELEKDRKHSDNNNVAGPVVLILGRNETGKTSVLRTLCHYSLRSGWNPTYVDINPKSNNLSLPGTITATPVEMQSKPKHLLQFAKTTPLVYYYGHKTIQSNQDLFLTQCRSIASLIDKRVLSSEMRGTDFPGYQTKTQTQPIPPHLASATKHAGIFIDTPGELGDDISKENINLIEEICKAFQVNIILVVDNEPLHAKLLQNQSFTTLNKGIAISRIPKLLGTVIHGADSYDDAGSIQTQQYFYGKKLQYRPFQQSLDMNKISIYSTLPIMTVPLTALPLGAAEEYKATIANKLDKVSYNDLRPNTIIALSYAQDENTLATTPVAGFIHIQAIPNQRDPVKSITQPVLYCLMPSLAPPHHLTNFLIGTTVWSDLTDMNKLGGGSTGTAGGGVPKSQY